MKSEGMPLRPVVGDSATHLGVRQRDLADDNGIAQPGKGGMSVVSSIAGLRRRVAKGMFPPRMVPQRLSDMRLVPGAIGPPNLHLFKIGEGAFEIGLLTDRLRLVPDHADHGTVQPAVPMLYAEYKQALSDTREQWHSGEHDDDR
jgi:hypothetical protein